MCAVVPFFALVASAGATEYVEDPGTPDYVWRITVFGKQRIRRAEVPAGSRIKPSTEVRIPRSSPQAVQRAENAAGGEGSAAAFAPSADRPLRAPFSKSNGARKSPAGQPSAAVTAGRASFEPPTRARKEPVFGGTSWHYTTSAGRRGIFEFRPDGTARYFDGVSEFPGTWAEVSRNVAFYRMDSDRNFMLFFLLSDDGASIFPFRPASSGTWHRRDVHEQAPAPVAPAGITTGGAPKLKK
jgi:hypothetical protein